MMKRREFITLLGGAAAAWPLAARAQQAERVRRIGVLSSSSAHEPTSQLRLNALQRGLQQAGWSEGRNVQIDLRWSAGNVDDLRKYAAELVALAPDAILANGSAALTLLLQATRIVPIVFTDVPDPVGAGFVDTLSRPGGNATGFMLFEYGMSGKWLELLKEIAPGVGRAAVLRDPAMIAGVGQFAAIQSVAPSLGVDLRPIDVRDAAEIERGVASFAREANSGLIAELSVAGPGSMPTSACQAAWATSAYTPYGAMAVGPLGQPFVIENSRIQAIFFFASGLDSVLLNKQVKHTTDF